MSKLILIVDDEESIRLSLKGILDDEGYQVIEAENGADAIDMIRDEVPDLVLLDIWMPGMDGVQALERIKNLFPDMTVVMMSGHGTIETAVRATRIGAFDFIEKPFSLDKLLITIGNALNLKELRKENEALRGAVLKEYELVGTSVALEQIRSQVQRIAPATSPVMILGEQGVGKELVARAIHHFSNRSAKPFVAVNCMAIPEELLTVELLGHEKGAFVGATSQKRGRLDLAEGGTLFLDEVQELSLKVQGELVRLLKEKAFERYGGGRTVKADIRVVVATSVDIEKAVSDGRLREDLYQLLQVFSISLPLLRERREDIPSLVRHFVNQFHMREGWEPKKFDESAIACLQAYDWPGNVRELKNIIERILIMAAGPVITADDLPVFLPAGACQVLSEAELVDDDTTLKHAREQFERDYIATALHQNDWDLDRVASLLGVERSVLQRKLIQYQIHPVD